MIYTFWGLTFLVTIFSYRKDKERTITALRTSILSLRKLLPGLFVMVALVGFVLAVVSKENIVAIFNFKGFYGFLLVSLLGALITIPGPIAFPLAGALLHMGASRELLATFITTLTMVGMLSSPFEISYFGKRFTFIRQGLSFIAAIMIGMIMGVFL